MAKQNASLSINSYEGMDKAQLTFARTSSATRVNKIGHVETVASGVIRFDHYPEPTLIGVHKGYLLEQTSENMCLQSEDFSTTWATSAASASNIGSVATNQIQWMSPDGGFTSDTLSAGSTATGIVAVRQQGFTFTNTEMYTVSVWAKKPASVGYSFLEMSNSDVESGNDTGNTFNTIFNLATGAVTSNTGTSASIEAYSGGWYRCSATFTADGNSNGEMYFKGSNAAEAGQEGSHTSGDQMYLWGAQIENAELSTSYIPTTTAAITRAADVASVSDTDNMWNWNAGLSLYVDYIVKKADGTETPVVHYADATNANYVSFMNSGKLRVTTDGSTQLGSDPFDTGFTNVAGTQYRNIMTMKTNDLHFASNGILSANLPDTSADVPLKSAASDYSIKFFHGSGYAVSGSGWIKGFRIYSSRMSNNDLQNLSVEVNTDISTLQISQLGTVANDTINADKLMASSVIESKINNGAVTINKIGADAVDGTKIADDAIGSEHYADDSVLSAHIADNQITSAHLALDVIVAEDIAANAITVSEIQDAAVTADKIAPGVVSGIAIPLAVALG
jgi:hypothetical protein